ncbi:MAG: TIGR00295 family protein [Candidatus Altiarchaeota archaeon]
MDREKSIQLLKSNNVQHNVIEHCLVVSSFAKEIAEKIKSNGHEIDMDFVESAALLHDIGRSKTHGIRHGIEGAALMKEYPRYARVCESHIGGGIGKDEAERIGLPAKDYLPETLEEKVICYADKLIHGTRKASLEQTLEKFRKRLGAHHPSIDRILELDREIRKLSGDY